MNVNEMRGAENAEARGVINALEGGVLFDRPTTVA